MAWIKRNLFFVIGAVVALALLGFAGFYTYSGWQHNAAEREKLNAQYEELKRLNNLNPHPGFGTVDNIKIAREQLKELHEVLDRAAKNFQSPAAIPNTPQVTSGDFTAALRRTVDQLTREAATASVTLPPDYKFSFSQQFRLLTFAPGSLEPLALQLGEVNALCDVLLKARINSIDGVQRERVSPDDVAGSQTDYLDMTSQTNELAVLTPYQLTFRSFSPEIAEVLAGFANSPYGIIVQAINVEPAAAGPESPGAPAMTAAPYVPAPVVPAPVYRTPRNMLDEDARERAQLRPDLFKYTPPTAPPAYPTPTYAAPPGYATATAARGGPQTVLNEKQLRVTLRVEIVKLLPRK
jgi:hypothetical protein